LDFGLDYNTAPSFHWVGLGWVGSRFLNFNWVGSAIRWAGLDWVT